MESDSWRIGTGDVQIKRDYYGSGAGNITIQYKTGDSHEACEADSWSDYIGDFSSLGWVKIKVNA